MKTKEKIINSWEHQGWGNRIDFFNFDKRRIDGHLTPLPQEGDEVRFKMGSGKIGRFKIIKMEPCRDPRDMFFATVEDIGYLEPPKEKGSVI